MFLRLLRTIAALVGHVFAVVLPVFARIFAFVEVVVPGIVVHVAAAVPPIRPVVIVVVHRGADRDARGEANHTCRDGGAVIAFLLHDHSRRLGVHNRRVVLRDIHDLRVGGLDDDHFRARRGRLCFNFLLRRALEVAGISRFRAKPLNAVEDSGAVLRKRLPQLRGPVDLLGHVVHDLREHHEGHETLIEARLGRRILQLGALERLVAQQPLRKRTDLCRGCRAEQHVRQQRVRIQRDWREELIELCCGGRSLRSFRGLRRLGTCTGWRRVPICTGVGRREYSGDVDDEHTHGAQPPWHWPAEMNRAQRELVI